MSDAWEELAAQYLRALAKRDMAVWRKVRDRENITMVPEKEKEGLEPTTKFKPETNCGRLIQAAKTSPEWMEHNT